MTLQVVKLSLGGHQPVRVGKVTHHVPQGSRVAHVTDGARALAYVLNANRVTCLIEAGEVPMSDRLQARVRAKVFDA